MHTSAITTPTMALSSQRVSEDCWTACGTVRCWAVVVRVAVVVVVVPLVVVDGEIDMEVGGGTDVDEEEEEDTAAGVEA